MNRAQQLNAWLAELERALDENDKVRVGMGVPVVGTVPVTK